jgi:peroxiredoxin
VSLDSPWSQRAFAESLGLGDAVAMLSDGLADAARGFGVLGELNGLPMAKRSVFLTRGGRVVASSLVAKGVPDIDAIVAAAVVA